MKLVTIALAGACLAAAPAAAMDLTSPDIANGARAPMSMVGSDCGGKNEAPALSWSDAPKETKSFTVMVYDLDARPTGFHHWIVVDIPPDVTSLPKGKPLPAGAVVAQNDYARARYDGPCPPKGTPHRYHVVVWAEDEADYPYRQYMTGTYIRPWMILHGIGKGEITVTYGR